MENDSPTSIEEVPQPKRRGRPPKAVEFVEAEEPKRPRGRPRKVVEEDEAAVASPPPTRARRRKLPDDRLEPAQVSFTSARGDVSFGGRKPIRAEPGKYSVLHDLQPHPHARFAHYIIS